MNKDWPSEEQDLREANNILAKYQDINEESLINSLDIVVSSEGNTTQLRAPIWMLEIARYFEQKYGTQVGALITQKVITKCLLRDVTIH